MAGVIGRLASWLGKYALLAAFLGIAALWTYSHLFPESLGSCHEVPVTIGAKATVRDCQAIPTTDFVVPVALVVFAALLLSTAEIELTIPGFGTVKRKREGEAAAEVLKQQTVTLDRRGEQFLEALPPAETPPQERPE